MGFVHREAVSAQGADRRHMRSHRDVSSACIVMVKRTKQTRLPMSGAAGEHDQEEAIVLRHASAHCAKQARRKGMPNLHDEVASDLNFLNKSTR